MLQTPLHPNPALYASPEMVMELALGAEPPYDIAARYGLSQGEMDQLNSLEWFGEMVLARRMDLQQNGQTFQAKAKMMAEELYQKLFQSALAGNLAHPLALEMAKQLTEIGGIKKGPVTGEGAGPAFQININVTNAGTPPGTHDDLKVIDVKPVVISVPADPLPARPEGFRVPDFRMTPDLVGTPQAVRAAQAAVPTTPARQALP